MGTIAARDALRVLQLSEQVAAGHVIACLQAIRLRQRSGDVINSDLSASLSGSLASMEAKVPFIDEDQPLDHVLRVLCADMAEQQWHMIWDTAP